MSFLQHVGNVFKKILGIAVNVAKVVEPEVDLALTASGLSGLVGLYNSSVGLAFGAETMAPSVTGTGAQKLAQLIAGLEPQAVAWAAQNGIVWPVADIQQWASDVVDTLNKIPSPTVAPVISPATPGA